MNKINLFFTIVLGFLFLEACNNRFEDDVFDKSASERTQAAIVEYRQLLTSANNGWIMEYYPGGETQSLGGFTYLLDFTETEVTAMLDLTGTVSNTSTYDIVPNGGPTLSFDTYNSIFHFFTTPSETQYNAFRGDFEFLLMSHTDTEIILKGKRYGTEMKMTKFSGSKGVFMNTLASFNYLVEEGGIKSLQVNGNEVVFSKTNRFLSYTDPSTSSVINIPYVYTSEGIRFYKPIIVNGKTVQELTFDGTGEPMFKNAEGTFVVTLYTVPPINFSRSVWGLFTNDPTKASTKLIQVFQDVHTANIDAVVGVTMDLSSRILLGDRTPQNRGVGIEFFSFISGTLTGYPSTYHTIFYGEPNKPNVLNMKFIGTAAGSLPGLSHYFPLRDIIINSAPYVVEATSDPKVVKLTSENDPDVWFTLEKLR